VYCEVTRAPLDVQDIMSRVRSDSDGAVVVFAGVVRNHHGGRAVKSLAYEAYEEMAVQKLDAICREVSSQHEIGDVAVAHRVGPLAVGEASVVIAVAAPHRDAAYKASREVIERLKHEVPIWKRERYADGEEEWVEGATPRIPEDD
jgi:molybdopterin synthase catalytic subunit